MLKTINWKKKDDRILIDENCIVTTNDTCS